jgi:hypothetical protein
MVGGADVGVAGSPERPQPLLEKIMSVSAAVERIVVQATPQEKKSITAKAKKLGIPVSELMRRGASAYESAQNDAELGELADRARLAAERASASIDDALAFVMASNKRIAAMEAKAAKTPAARPVRAKKAS